MNFSGEQIRLINYLLGKLVTGPRANDLLSS